MRHRRIPKVCIEGNCPELSYDGNPRCDEHRREQERERSRARRAAGTDYGSDHRWRQLAARMRRERGCCAECGATESLDVHHLDGRGLKGPRAYDETNVVVLCHRCHSRVTRARQTSRPHPAAPAPAYADVNPPGRHGGIRSVGLG